MLRSDLDVFNYKGCVSWELSFTRELPLSKIKKWEIEYIYI